jgi:His-Xaa-Ser system protein HxsD
VSPTVVPSALGEAVGPDSAHFAPESDASSRHVAVDTSLYTLDAMFRACYKFTDRCFVFLERGANDTVIVHLRARTVGSDLAETIGAFQNELLDQRLRMDLARETRTIREWIVAQAFVEADLDLPPR